MKKLLHFIIFLILTSFSSKISAQHGDSYNFDIARELGHCYDTLTPIKGDPDFYYPLCSDSSVRVFFLEPNYYCVYTDALGWCGSCGCHLDIYKFEDSIYKDLGIYYCINLDMKQPINNYILISDLHKTSSCWTSYKGKYNIKNDWLNLFEIVDYNHEYFGSKSDFPIHNDTCKYVDSLWLFK
tara:strand:+ start:414 stop:962 length:549 start_codon:yes stop_codon:yes gene_type:complete